MRKRLFAAIVPLLLVGLTPAGFSSDHSILGVVTDINGSVVGSASVTAVPLEESGSAGDLGWVHTDNSGRFRLLLRPGHYVIRAKDEADGYPDPSFLLCSDSSANFPRVSVEGLDVSGVRVVLGTRGGVLEGDLRDALTQQPIPNAKVTIRDAHSPNAFVEVFADKTGHFRFTVPSKPIHLIATAEGHKEAQYEGEPLILSGGQHRSVKIKLRPQ
jgi:hypothetical protein